MDSSAFIKNKKQNKKEWKNKNIYNIKVKQ